MQNLLKKKKLSIDIGEESYSAKNACCSSLSLSLSFLGSFKTHAGLDIMQLELMLPFFSPDYKSGSSTECQRQFMASDTIQ